MARGAQGAIITRFDADYTGLEEGAKTSVNIISEFGKKSGKASKGFELSTRDMRGAVADLGRELKQSSPILGEFLGMLSKNKVAMDKLTAVSTIAGRAIIAGLSTPIGAAIGVVVGLGAAVGGLIYYLGRTQSQAQLSKESLDDYRKSLETYKTAIDDALISERLHGEVLKAGQSRIQAASNLQGNLAKKIAEMLHSPDIVNALNLLSGEGGKLVTLPSGAKLSTGYTASMAEIKAYQNILKDPVAKKQLESLISDYKNLNKQIDFYKRKTAEMAFGERGGGLGPVTSGLSFAVSSALAAYAQVSKEIARKAAEEFRDKETYRGGLLPTGADFAITASIEAYKQLSSQLRQVEDEKKRQIELEKELADASREASRQQLQDLQEKLEYAKQYDLATIQAGQLESAKVSFQEWGVSLQANMADVYEGVMSTSSMAIQGFGDAVAQAIVYQQNFGAAMAALGKQVAASVISMLVQIGLQQLLYFAIGKTLLAAETSAKLASQIAIGSAAAAASAFMSVPFPANFAAAAVAGELAAGLIGAQATAGAALGNALGASIAGAKAGALTLGEGILHVHQDEIIAPRSDYERLMGKGRASAGMTAVFELDGREFTRAIMPWLPGEVRRIGIRGM